MTTMLPGTTTFALESHEALANFAINSVFGGTIRASDKGGEAKLIELAATCNPEFVAKLAVYAYEVGKLRDVSALLTAWLVSQPELFKRVAARTLPDLGQVRKAIHYRLKGPMGRKTINRAFRRYVEALVNGLSEDQLFQQSLGQHPSLKDILRLTHVRDLSGKAAIFDWACGKPSTALPQCVQRFNAFKEGTCDPDKLPAVPAAMLQGDLAKMTLAQKMLYLHALTPNQLRRELVTLQKHGVYDLPGAMDVVLEKVGALSKVRNTTLPLSLYITIRKLQSSGLPKVLTEALTTQLEALLHKAVSDLLTQINRPLTVAVDYSGSMGYTVAKAMNQDPLMCFEAACLFAWPLLKSPHVTLGMVAERYKPAPTHVTRSMGLMAFMHAMQQLNNGGGTALGEVLKSTHTPDTLIISDCESWSDYGNRSVQEQWLLRRDHSDRPRLILWDIQPNQVSPALTEAQVFNMGGLSERVYSSLASFMAGGRSLVDQVEAIRL